MDFSTTICASFPLSTGKPTHQPRVEPGSPPFGEQLTATSPVAGWSVTPVSTGEEDPGRSYLYDVYKDIFTHMGPYLGVMARLLREGRSTSEVMEVVKGQKNYPGILPPRRKAPCPCGSGKKYKHCCGKASR